jgi:hypothetical protein
MKAMSDLIRPLRAVAKGGSGDINLLAARAADEIERLRGPHYLQGDGGWYALSVSSPRYCFHADTLEAVKELEARAREMTKTALGTKENV